MIDDNVYLYNCEKHEVLFTFLDKCNITVQYITKYQGQYLRAAAPAADPGIYTNNSNHSSSSKKKTQKHHKIRKTTSNRQQEA